MPASVFGKSASSKQSSKPLSATIYDQSFAFDNMLVNSEAYRRSMGISPLATSRNPSSQSGLAEMSNPMKAKEEKERLGKKNEVPSSKPAQSKQQSYLLPCQTTAPKKYCVRPNHGSIDSGTTIKLGFISGARKKGDCKPEGIDIDKFAIELLVIVPGESFEWQRDRERRHAEIQRVEIKAEPVWREQSRTMVKGESYFLKI
ncbi:hypothetical protein BKA65DRAFT_481288 [Rhexocercosporidium sp. MPI-PUGE-AT-0058]|nr:hypothetical protein BKA65DRAFT_481288 [Rhexocercosporidium sp. MPI-PUGE-AT-0058]